MLWKYKAQLQFNQVGISTCSSFVCELSQSSLVWCSSSSQPSYVCSISHDSAPPWSWGSNGTARFARHLMPLSYLEIYQDDYRKGVWNSYCILDHEMLTTNSFLDFGLYLGSIPGRVISKTRKNVLIPLCLTLSNIRYVSMIKWKNPGKGVAPSPTYRCSSYCKESLLVALDYGRQLYLLYYRESFLLPLQMKTMLLFSLSFIFLTESWSRISVQICGPSITPSLIFKNDKAGKT